MTSKETALALIPKLYEQEIITEEEGKKALLALSTFAAERGSEAQKNLTEMTIALHAIRELKLFTFDGFETFSAYQENWMLQTGLSHGSVGNYLQAARFWEARKPIDELMEYDGGIVAVCALLREMVHKIDPKTGEVLAVQPEYEKLLAEKAENVDKAMTAYITETFHPHTTGRTVLADARGQKKEANENGKERAPTALRFFAVKQRGRDGEEFVANTGWEFTDANGQRFGGTDVQSMNSCPHVLRMYHMRLGISVER